MATINIAVPQVYMPAGSTAQPNIRSANPIEPILDGQIVIFSSGSPAAGFYNLGGLFNAGDTITYAVNGVGGSSPIAVTSITQAVQALVNDINSHTGTNLVNAKYEFTPNGYIVLMEANLPGTAGNSITTTISTTSGTGTVVASGATLVGGTAASLSGLVAAPANVASGIAGVAVQNSVQNYGGSEQVPPALNAIFGYSQINTILVPGDAGETKYATLQNPALLEINLSILTGWVSGGTYQAQNGTAVGIGIDPTTGFYVADPNASNKVATIEQPLIGPSFGSAIPGTIAQRVRIAFYPAAIV